MSSIWIKICANTTLHDARLAAKLGADAVGFVFAPSKRQVTVAQVAEITPHLPAGVERVGVFVGSTPADIEAIAQAAQHAGLTAVQLHGGSNPVFAEGLRRRLGRSIALIQTAHWTIGADAASASALTRRLVELSSSQEPDRLLIDAKLGAASGGLGRTFDWEAAQPVLATHTDIRVVVAGGLDPDNVAAVIQCLRPYGVDVASGVERVPGIKDSAKLKAFIDAARGEV